jgi:hypothetical protein
MASVMAQKMLGAERKPNGSALSRYVVLFYVTASKRWSEEWTGTAR